MTDEDVLLLNSVLGVHLEYPCSVVETHYYQLLAHYLTHIDRDPVPSHFLLVPEQDYLVLVPRYQHAAQD